MSLKVPVEPKDLPTVKPTANSRFQLQKLVDLKPHAQNPRRHAREQVRAIARSIERFGFNAPILTDQDRRIIAGCGRYEAAKLIGLAEVPTILLNHLDEHELKAYMLADNKLNDLSDWDDRQLALILQELDVALGFDIAATGFEAPEVDLRIQSLQLDDIDEADYFEVSAEIPVAKLGDTWTLGSHKIYCGSALDPLSFQVLLGDQKASAAFIDPPYNVKIVGHVRGKGRTQHREFVMGSK